jgi:AbrB family looped-hinge helix DNA binding protein
MARLGRNGQITIPKPVREAFGLLPGTQVEFVVHPGEIVIRKASVRPAIEKWAGHLTLAGGPQLSSDDIMNELRGERDDG